ncbi:MAG: DUF4142 domain-containing protein [Pyrinomonadaceae bacterium]
MGMYEKTVAGALMAAGILMVGGTSSVAQQNQSNNPNTTTTQTTNQGGNTSQGSNQTTQDSNKTNQDSNRTTPDSTRTTQDPNRTTPDTTQSTTQGTTQDANRDMNRATGQQVTNRSGSNTSSAGMLSSADRKFVMDAAMGGMTEVEIGRLASQNGSSDAVKQFGERLVQDHTKANEELMTLAGSKGITLSKELDAKHKTMVAKMSATSGAEFDRAFIKEMQKDHKKDISMFQKQADKGMDADLKAFAAKTLPTLREHAQMIDQMNTGMSGMKGMSGTKNTSGMDNPSGTTSQPSSGTGNSSNPGTTSPSNTGTTNPSSTGTSNPSDSTTTRPKP